MDSKPKKHEWFKISFVLIFVSSFIMLAIGYALQSVHQDNLKLQIYLSDAQNIQVDFENSLSVYTSNIQTSLEYLTSLRPQDETGYIEFISKVEDMALSYGISLDIQTSDKSTKPDMTGSYYVDYRLSFNSNQDQLWAFTKNLETLPYFIRVTDLEFQSLSDATRERDFLVPNVELTLRLYVE